MGMISASPCDTTHNNLPRNEKKREQDEHTKSQEQCEPLDPTVPEAVRILLALMLSSHKFHFCLTLLDLNFCPIRNQASPILVFPIGNGESKSSI